MDANDSLAQKIRERSRTDGDFTMQITAHDTSYTNVERLTTARLMSWTVRAGCDHAPRTMETEWMDVDEFARMFTLPELPPINPVTGLP